METRKDQTESCKDKGACPCGVDQMKTTGMADGEVTSQSSLAGPCMWGREKVVRRRVSAAAERTASAMLCVGGTYLGREE